MLVDSIGVKYSMRFMSRFLFFNVFGRPFVKRFAYAIGPLYVCPVCLSVLSVLSVTFVHCGQTVGRIKMKLGSQVGFGSGHYVLDGDPAPPPPKEGGVPQFSAHICCSQMAGWIKMPLGMEVDLSPGDFVLHGDPALLSQNWRQSPLPMFRSISIVVKRLQYRCMHQDATWYGGKPQSRGLCVRWEPSPSLLNFRPMFITVIVISLEHCTVVVGLFKFKFKFYTLCILFLEKFNRIHAVNTLCTVAPHT